MRRLYEKFGHGGHQQTDKVSDIAALAELFDLGFGEICDLLVGGNLIVGSATFTDRWVGKGIS
jgi:uncharacterized protein (UPF0261 family)